MRILLLNANTVHAGVLQSRTTRLTRATRLKRQERRGDDDIGDVRTSGSCTRAPLSGGLHAQRASASHTDRTMAESGRVAARPIREQ